MIRAALVAAAVKDAHLLLRDRGALATLFALPVVFIVVFGLMFQGGGGVSAEGGGGRIAVYYPGGDDRGASILESVDASPVFDAERAADPERAREIVAAGDAAAALVIPTGFAPAGGEPIELVLDELAAPRLSGAIRGAVTSAIASALFGDLGGAEWLEVRPPPGREPAREDLSGFELSVPGNAVLFGFFLALTMALSFVEERERGTWRRVLAAPASRRVVLLGKLAPYLALGLLQMALFFGVGIIGFDMRVAGSPWALAGLTGAVVFCAVGLGLLLASLRGTSKQIGGAGSIALLVLALLGGSMVPRLLMPDTMQTLGLVTPHAWALEGYYAVIGRPEVGAGDIAAEICALLGFGAAFAALGAARFRFE